MKSILILLGLLIGSANAEAGEVAAMGIGTLTCTVFADMYKLDPTEAENVYFAWTQGYLSGSNAALIAEGKPFRNLASMDTKDQEAYLRRYCDQHPLGNYIDAVMSLSTNFAMVPPPQISN
jgi:hypothetical protein